MAKILLVTKQVSQTVVQLANALRASQHRVFVMTSRDQDVQLHPDISLITPFRSWSPIEAIRCIPFLWGQSPNIIHFVLDQEELNSAQLTLVLYAKSRPDIVITTSLLNIRLGLGTFNPVRYLLEESDIVTCPSVESMAHLRGLNIRRMRQGRGILPPMLKFSLERNLVKPEQEELTAKLPKLFPEKALVVPFLEQEFHPGSAFFRRMVMMANHHPLILLGSNESWPLRERKKFARWLTQLGLGKEWILTGSLNRSLQIELLKQSQAFVIAGLSLSPLELTEYYDRAIQSGCTLIMDDQQGSVHAGFWQDAKNCWILRKGTLHEDLHALLKKPNIHLETDLSSGEKLQRDLIDAPLNELNRLYNKALAQKSWI